MKRRAYSILDNAYTSTAILIFVLGVVIFIWIFVPEYLNKEYSDIEQRGAFGDSFGAVNALFTGLAFAGLLFTIFLQQREIKLQREDFFEQLEEMKLSRGESTKLAIIQSKQISLGMADLKMKILEVEIAHIQMKSLSWDEASRAKVLGPELIEVQKKMQGIVDEVRE